MTCVRRTTSQGDQLADEAVDDFLLNFVAHCKGRGSIAPSYLEAAVSVLGNGELGPLRGLIEEIQRRIGLRSWSVDSHRPTDHHVELPDAISAEVEHQCWEHYCPRVEEVGGGCRKFVIPPWFARGRMKSSVCVVLDADGYPRTFTMCHEQARAPLLLSGAHTNRKRTSTRYVKWAARMRDDLADVLGKPRSEASQWLDCDFEGMEASALHVWRELIAATNVPVALRGWPLTLGVLWMCGTAERRYFAEHWTWAAFAATQVESHDREEVLAALRDLDRNTANAVMLANRMLGWRHDDHAGATARRALARKLPRIPAIDQLSILGKDSNSGRNFHRRYVLFGAHTEGDPLPARLLRSEPRRVLGHLSFAAAVGWALYSDGVYDFHRVVERLIARMLVGTATAVGDVEADVVAQAFYRASSDCIALVASANGFPGGLDAGVFALAHFFGGVRLGFPQLVRWAEEVVPPTDLRFKGDMSVRWAPPPGWDARFAREHGTMPLQSIAEILEEGDLQGNCLARGFHHDAAASGRIHILKMDSTGGRATLALREHADLDQRDHVVDYSIAELKGARNAEPSRETKIRSKALLRALKSRLPAPIPPGELKRRRGRKRSYVKDPKVTAQLWRDVYAASLPRHLRGTSPRQVVAAMPSLSS